MSYSFHILGVPHTVSVREYSTCAYTQKVVKLCKILKSRGHTVIHYGHEDSRVDCDEHVTVTNRDDLYEAYGDHDWRKEGPPKFHINDRVYKTFTAKAIAALHTKKQRRDFLLCPFGNGHKPTADAHSDMIICEPGIGSHSASGFAKFRVFESYSLMHAYLGKANGGTISNSMWYDVVIPNYFDLDDFEFSATKDDYFLFLGRLGPGKGTHIALQIVEEVGGRLVVAGPIGFLGKPRTSRPISEYTELVGVVDPEERKHLLARAKATIAASTFLEPFCGVQIESMLSGTPVISTDWGAFTEYNVHGITGYRCRTFEQFTWAARNIHAIDPYACRTWAERNFSLERVADMYEEYFYSVSNIFGGKGWYQQNPARSDLNWLYRFPPEPDGSSPPPTSHTIADLRNRRLA